jgi:hypothetical protein
LLRYDALVDQTQNADRTDRKVQYAASRHFGDGTFIELIYDPTKGSTNFAVWQDGSFGIEPSFKSQHGELLRPYSPENNLIKNEVVALPSEPIEYESEESLVADIAAYIHRYADLDPLFEQVATYYVLLSWLYDAFNELPYLRFRGDYGTGKTRALLTIGSICYKAFFASGASTVSPIFHTLDAFRGTLIFDEADFRFSDEQAEIVKILNNGNVRGVPVLRTIINRNREYNPNAFQVFGPKIVATRGNYEDRGLESRFLTEDMTGRQLRNDIPINMPPSFKEEARELRNKLLMYRFHTRPKATLDASLVDRTLEPRLNQILLPLLSVIRSEELRAQLRSIAAGAQASLMADRGFSPEAHVLEILAELMSGSERPVSVGDVAAGMFARYGTEYDRPITNRWIGGLLRRRLNIRTYKSHGVFVVAPGERAKVDQLCIRYGLAPSLSAGAVQLGDVGTSGTA